MKYIVGDLFSFIPEMAIVIPTNLGWKRSGENVMGAGIAKQAAETWPTLAHLIGEYYKQNKERSEVIGFSVFAPQAHLIAFPVKPLKPGHANLSWQQPASLELIEKSVQELASLVKSLARYQDEIAVALPRVGCGNGQLAFVNVKPILERYLDDRFLLVTHPSDENSPIEFHRLEI